MEKPGYSRGDEDTKKTEDTQITEDTEGHEKPDEEKGAEGSEENRNTGSEPGKTPGGPPTRPDLSGIRRGDTLNLVMKTLILFCTLTAIILTGASILSEGGTQEPAASGMENGDYSGKAYSEKPLLLKTSGEALSFEDNAAAHNPGWDELIVFLKEDETDRLPYTEGNFTGADFAERLHNNAEKAGLRAAVVSVTFRDKNQSRIINAFESTDKGLVYVDCTGTEGSRGELDSFDKIAYVEAGKEYGLISAYYTHSPEYEYYDIRKNKKVKGFYRSPGITESWEIYWGGGRGNPEVSGNSEIKARPSENTGPETETGVEGGDKLRQIKDSFSAISEEMRNIGGLLKELAVEGTEI